METSAVVVGDALGDEDFAELVDAIGGEFPDVETATEPVRLEEMLLVRIANENPAARPLLPLVDDSPLPTEERDVPVRAIAEADEAFLSSTTREVQPIAHVDGEPQRSVGGAVSRRLAHEFRALVARNLDP